MRIHFIAIGGAVMHQLAIELQNNGHLVTGSDDEIFDPAKTNLSNNRLLPSQEGWFPENITEDIDAIILGMHAKEGNPELEKARMLHLPIYSFPEYIYEFSKFKKRVVIAGSHGKTSTTSMIMHVLKEYEIEFDYLVGAKVQGFENSVRLSNAPIIILEGDEYPASTIEPRPKIHFYHPDIAVLTGIAWDHINVFPTFENYLEQFSIFLDQMEEGKTIIYCSEDKEVVKLIEQNTHHLRLLPYVTPNYEIEENKVILNSSEGNYELQIFGAHNLQNLEAARKVCFELGISNEDFYTSIAKFSGAAKRLEKIIEDDDLIVYRDFAHAPSKLKATLKAAREKYQDRYLIACFELHTYSSLNQAFHNEYNNALDDCDAAAVYFSPHALSLKGLPGLSPESIKESFSREDLEVFSNNSTLLNWIKQKMNFTDLPICLLMMSSGTFDGLDLKF